MAELTIRPEEVRDALANFVKSYQPSGAGREEIGIVTEASDGIARVEGLPSTMTNELLKFENGTLGLALNLDVREIGVVILGAFSGIEEGTKVYRTGEILSVPVGDAFLGRVVDALGRPVDGKGPIAAETNRALELQAPTVVQRQPVKEPLMTGIKAIDSMTAIGRGQRQLIIGDRQTGKTAVAVDTIINQLENWKSGDKKKRVKCIYVAIGQKGSTVASVRAALEEAGAMEYTTIVSAPASDPAGFKYLAPYTGSAIGQHWMYNGDHVLIVFDDLSKQAEAYRSADNIFILGRQQEKEGTELVGYNFIINVEKSRYVREKSKIPITVSFDGGISRWSGLLDIALESGHVVKPSNGWYSRQDENGVEDTKIS